MSATNLLHDAVIKAVCVDTTSGMYAASSSAIVYSGCINVESDMATKKVAFRGATLLFVAIDMNIQIFLHDTVSHWFE